MCIPRSCVEERENLPKNAEFVLNKHRVELALVDEFCGVKVVCQDTSPDLVLDFWGIRVCIVILDKSEHVDDGMS